MPRIGHRVRNVKRSSLLKDSKDLSRARAPIGTPHLHTNDTSRIQILKRPQTPIQPSLSQSLQQPSSVYRASSSPSQEMAYFGDSASSMPFSFHTDMRLPPPPTRRGRATEENEEPRSTNPVSLEDFIVYKPNRNNRNRDRAGQMGGHRTDHTQNSSAPPFDEPRQMPKLPTRPSFMTRTPSLASSGGLLRSTTSQIDTIGLEFREIAHMNGDLTVSRRSAADDFVPIGRIDQSDVSYFLRFCERSFQDNQHDNQKLELYREHIDTMVRHMDEKRIQRTGGQEPPDSVGSSARERTQASSGSPVARRESFQTTSASDPASDHMAPRSAARTIFLNLSGSTMTMNQPDRSRRHTPQTAFFSGNLPNLHQQNSDFWPLVTHEEQAQQAREREQRALYVQQHFAAQRAGGTNLTGYEPSMNATVAHNQHFPETQMPYPEPQHQLVFNPNPAIWSEQQQPPALPAPRALRSMFTTMPSSVQEFVPKTRPPAMTLKEEPETFAELLLHSAPFNAPDERRLARESMENENPFEPSTMTDDELRAAVSLESQHPKSTPTRATESQYLRELDEWWHSGSDKLKASEAYSRTILGGNSLLDDRDANIGTPLMVMAFKTFQEYQQSKKAGQKEKGAKMGYFAKQLGVGGPSVTFD